MTTCESIPLDSLKALLASSEWASGPLYFIGDVGGTNARLGFAHATASGGVVIRFVLFSMSKASVDQLQEFFATILSTLGPDAAAREPITSRIANGALSLPGPCTNNQVAGPFNNLKGVAKLSEYPAELFPHGRSALLNDLEAGAFGVLAVSDAGAFAEYFKVLWKGTHWESSQVSGSAGASSVAPVGTALGRGRCFVVAPGTGMGNSLITYSGVQGRYDVLPLEYGSQTLAYSEAPIGGADYIPFLEKALKLKPGYAPNWEQACNGRSLSINYRYLCEKKAGKAAHEAMKTPGQVARLAEQGDPIAMEALGMYFRYIFSYCGEGIMAFLPLTCVLIGDNVMKNQFFFERDPANVEMLKKTMMRHPMEQDFGFLGRTTLLRQVKPVNLNLMGCYGFGRHLTMEGDATTAAAPVTHISSKL